ncbi:hypothetical protein ACIBG8_20130 [Nonomuraea sp. NPDC050556]
MGGSGCDQCLPGPKEIPMVKTVRRYAKFAVSALSTAVFVHSG